MDANIFIKYKGLNDFSDSEIDLTSLGESIIGFDSLFREIFNISKIKGSLQLNIAKTREGSLIIDIAIKIFSTANGIPFATIKDLLDFLSVVDPILFLKASRFFATLGSAHRTVNDFFAVQPFDAMVLVALLAKFYEKFIKNCKWQKRNPDLDKLPKNYALSAHLLIKKGKFKKALKPLVDDKVSTIEVSSDKDFNERTTILPENFGDYLSEDEKILAQYENGKAYIFVGQIVAMQCAHGDSMKIKIEGLPRAHRNIIAFPPNGTTTKDYNIFYQNLVVFKALVERKSLYQKPKLYIQNIRLQQEPLI